MNNIKFWQKIHRFQEKGGWCGPAVVQMVLASCGIKKTQAKIAKDIYKPWWGSNQQMLLAYLSRYFKVVNYKQNSKTTDISFHLKKGHILVVNWWDDLDVSPDGHYSLVIDYIKKTKELVLADPSRSRKGIWKIKAKEFSSKWWDTLDIHGRTWVDGWLLWVDPASKID